MWFHRDHRQRQQHKHTPGKHSFLYTCLPACPASTGNCQPAAQTVHVHAHRYHHIMAAAIMPNGPAASTTLHNQGLTSAHSHLYLLHPAHSQTAPHTHQKSAQLCLPAHTQLIAFADTEARHIFFNERRLCLLDRPPYLSWHKPPEWMHQVNL